VSTSSSRFFIVYTPYQRREVSPARFTVPRPFCLQLFPAALSIFGYEHGTKSETLAAAANWGWQVICCNITLLPKSQSGILGNLPLDRTGKIHIIELE
jgi:hypothetical protein